RNGLARPRCRLRKTRNADRQRRYLHCFACPESMIAESDQPLSWWMRGIWIVILGGFFFLVYGGCNWISAQRASVPSFSWAWEQRIPFIPTLIVPYMSLDLFFAGAIWLCGKNELKLHAKRVVAAISIAAVCFLVFPLKYSFAKPETTGFYGLL